MIKFDYDKRIRDLLQNVEKNEEKIKSHKQEQSKVRKRLLIVILFIFLFFVVMYLFSKYKEQNLTENGTLTEAQVAAISHRKYITNELAPVTVNVYFIRYSFFVENEKYEGISEISNSELEDYFDTEIKAGSVIKIMYDPNNPDESEIVKK
jgi:cell division protein FtsL